MLLIVNSIQGQIISIDSLDNDGLYNEFYSALPKNQNRAFKIAKLFVKRQKENNDINNLLDGYSLLIESDYKNSLKYLDTIINLSKNLEDKLYYPAGGYFALASAHYKNKNYQAALNNFIKTFELANDNKYLKNNALNNIGILKLEKVNEEKEALEIFKECLDFYKNPLDKEYYIENFLVLNFSISEAYRSLNKIDSSQYYNKEGLKYHDKYAKDTDLNNYFIYSEGINNYKQGNYKEAALKLKEAYPTLINYDDMDNAVIANYYLGKSYEKLNLKYFQWCPLKQSALYWPKMFLIEV